MSKRWLKYSVIFLWLFAWDYGSDFFRDGPMSKSELFIRLPLEIGGALLILYLFRTKAHDKA